MAEKFNEALKDCEESIKIDPYFYKGYTRAAHCYLQLGSLEKAEQVNINYFIYHSYIINNLL